ncbi:MAG: carbonic anhydrase [bacterium]|nr:carbonic anhydrase [bacterium]
MCTLRNLLEKNKQWSERVKSSDHNFFIDTAGHQNPEYLWIGCSDSRVSATNIVDVQPGEMFVHRNIANIVLDTDPGCLSVIQYGVQVLKVKHIIVCGHYGCGGIKAVINDDVEGVISVWLQTVRDLYIENKDKINVFSNPDARADLLSEINVLKQVENIYKTEAVQKAYRSGQELYIHGWIYDLKTGTIKDLNICIAQ